MSTNDINRLCVLDLACMKHCGKQLPTLTLTLIFSYVQQEETAECKRKKRIKPKTCPRIKGTNDVFAIVPKGSRKKKWATSKKENRQCVTQYRMKRALRIAFS
jgi:hypothetical protein